MDSVTININGQTTILNLEKKDFKSGKSGYFTQGKATDGKDRFQAQLIATKIVK